MAIFQSVVLMLVLACLLLQVSRRLQVPYPSMLALAGVGVASLPWISPVSFEPHLALILFIAPALLDSAFDTSPRELKHNWLPLLSLVFGAVLVTAAVVAWVGVSYAGLPIAAAITLGAIVAPPDAVAAAAVMQQFKVPRRTLSVLNGESLLNDAVALVLFGMAASLAIAPESHWSSVLPPLILAVPGGAVLGIVIGKINLFAARSFAGTRSAIIYQFVMTFGTWIAAEHLHVSPIISVVAMGMTVARHAPARIMARDRIHANAVWGAAVFILNVLAFMLMGMQAKLIIGRLTGDALRTGVKFALLVTAAVIFTRIVWVMLYGLAIRMYAKRLRKKEKAEIAPPSKRIGLLVGWSGMRGLVTLATSFALPADFPGRDLIVISAFSVVLGTLVLQGFTIGPLIKLLNFKPDTSFDQEMADVKKALTEVAAKTLEKETGEEADAVRAEYLAWIEIPGEDSSASVSKHDQHRASAIRAQRELLTSMRNEGRIQDDVYHRLEEELDLKELAASDSEQYRLISA